MRRSWSRHAATALLCSVVVATAGRAQESSCARIAFGPWSPALEWSRAGHRDSANRVGAGMRAVRDSVFTGAASASGRDEMHWGTSSNGILQLRLAPSWWPVGVIVSFPGVRPRDAAAPPDTILGEAVALVADAAQTPPRSRVRVIRAPC